MVVSAVQRNTQKREHYSEQTDPHLTALTAIATIISQDRIVTGGRDNLVKVFDQEGVLERSISTCVISFTNSQ